MSIDDLLRHSLVIKRNVPTGAFDADGLPVVAPVTVATVAGLIQPRTAREVALASQSGAVIGEYVGYVRPLAALGTDCWIESGGSTYQVVTMPDAGGQSHHLELGLTRVS